MMAEVFNPEFKTIQSFKRQRFSVRQRESDQIHLFVTLKICLTQCHTLSQSMSLCCRNYFKCNVLQNDVKTFDISFTFTAQNLRKKRPKQNYSLNCQVVSNLDTKGPQAIKTLRHFPVSFVSIMQ